MNIDKHSGNGSKVSRRRLRSEMSTNCLIQAMRTLTVALGDRSYPIHIGPGLLERPELLLEHLAQKRVVIVTNDVVAPLYLDAFEKRLSASEVQSIRIVLPDGEDHKNWHTLNTILDAMRNDSEFVQSSKARRDSQTE